MRHQFHSELACDEVWYRLNILLQNFAVCGPKRCEVRGELAAWGCYLWLRRPGGYGGTPVPLRLWTEEGETPGCEIVCTFLPSGREWRWLLIIGGGLWLEAFFAGLAGGVPFFRALLAGLVVGSIASAVLSFLIFGLARLLSLRRERELLQWIQAYLLLQEPEGILLPDLETQKAVWAGFLPEAEPVEKRRFVFHSPLPPEKLPAALEAWASPQNLRHAGREVKWSVESRRNRVKISRVEIEWGQEEGRQRGPGFFAVSSARFKSWQYANPFWGAVEPDGRGGSVLPGAFLPHRLFTALRLLAALAVCLALCLNLPLRLALPLSLAAAGLFVIPVWKSPLKNPGSLEILRFLQTYLEEM